MEQPLYYNKQIISVLFKVESKWIEWFQLFRLTISPENLVTSTETLKLKEDRWLPY